MKILYIKYNNEIQNLVLLKYYYIKRISLYIKCIFRILKFPNVYLYYDLGKSNLYC